jgi:hypothetical protein
MAVLAADVADLILLLHLLLRQVLEERLEHSLPVREVLLVQIQQVLEELVSLAVVSVEDMAVAGAELVLHQVLLPEQAELVVLVVVEVEAAELHLTPELAEPAVEAATDTL